MSLREKRVLVTGAGGFVGAHLCRVLHAQGATQVVGFTRGRNACARHVAEQHMVDISDRLRLRQLVQSVQPELVVHLAAAKNRGLGQADYRVAYETNLLGSLNLIEACEELTALGRFVFLGTWDEYGQHPAPFDESSRELPVSAYGVTKLAVTQLLQTLARARGFPAVILRPSIAYGPGQGTDMFLPALIKALVSGEKFRMSRGEQTRDFLYIDDLVNAIVRALDANAVQGRVINICSASPVRIDALARKAARLIGPEAERMLDFGARDYRPGEGMDYRAGNSLARTLLGWAPEVPLEAGLRQTIEYFRAGTPGNR